MDNEEEIVEIELDDVIHDIDGYDDDMLELIVRELRDVLRDGHEEVKLTGLSKQHRRYHDIMIELISKRKPHIAFRVLTPENVEYLCKRRCISCRFNKPCQICGIKTPLGLFQMTTPKSKVPFVCNTGGHYCKKCSKSQI